MSGVGQLFEATSFFDFCISDLIGGAVFQYLQELVIGGQDIIASLVRFRLVGRGGAMLDMVDIQDSGTIKPRFDPILFFIMIAEPIYTIRIIHIIIQSEDGVFTKGEITALVV